MYLAAVIYRLFVRTGDKTYNVSSGTLNPTVPYQSFRTGCAVFCNVLLAQIRNELCTNRSRILLLLFFHAS